jgi:hypothetical protein
MRLMLLFTVDSRSTYAALSTIAHSVQGVCCDEPVEMPAFAFTNELNEDSPTRNAAESNQWSAFVMLKVPVLCAEHLSLHTLGNLEAARFARLACASAQTTCRNRLSSLSTPDR